MTEVAARRPRLAVLAVLTAMALVVLDAGVANVALPAIGEALGASPARSVLVVTAYQVALVMALLPCGALGERFGHRPVFAWGLAVFMAASGLCAVAPSLPWLVAARFMQGLGGAAIMALGVALMRAALPPGRLATAISWNAMTVALAAAAAPTLGAVIVSSVGWPWLFGVNLPLGIVALTAARALPGEPSTGRGLDLVGIVLNGLAFGLLIVAAEIVGAAPATAVGLGAGGVIALTLLVRRQASRSAPLIPLDLLRIPAFRVSVIASICCFMGQTAGLVALPFYLQHGLDQTPLATGLYMTAWPLSVAAAATLIGRMADRLPTRWLCFAGGGLLATGLAAMAAWPMSDPPAVLIPLGMLCGLGFGLFQVPNNRILFLSAPTDRSGAAGGMQGTARLTGQTAGAVMMTLLFSHAPVDLAARLGLALAAGLTLTAGLVSLAGARSRIAS